MGAPKSGWLEVSFSQPICQFCCYVTSSQRTILSAYDHRDNLLNRASVTSPNLAGSDSQIPPNAQLRIEEQNISRITFYAFDGQMTLADLSFGF
jgi:superfamily I DNA and RNA helicase